MNKEIKAKWVAELRSGKYRQIRKMLRDHRNGRCCLGVLADVNGAKWTNDVHTSLGSTLSCTTYHGQGTGLRSSDAEVLQCMNDDGYPFSAIADWIEANL